jgi:hypothetical protein
MAKWLGGQAPVHVAQVYEPCHDGRMHLLEARRGRGKSYGMAYWVYLWLIDMLPGIKAGKYPYSKAITNFKIDPVFLAYRLCEMGHMSNLADALDLVNERVIYGSNWDDFFVSYQCGLFLDESNRSLDAYNKKSSEMLSLAHDFHQQSRKHKNTMVYATQYIDWINTQTRKLFDLLWRAKVVRDKSRRGPDGLYVPRYFNYYGSDPMANGVDSSIVRRADFKFQLPFVMGVAMMYQSWEPIVTFSGDVKPRWASFKELAEWMEENDLKPKPAAPRVDRLHLYDANRHPVIFEPGSGAGVFGAQVSCDTKITAPRLSDVPPVLDLSSLPVGFPKSLL